MHNIRTHIKAFKTCHKNKKQDFRYGNLSAKEAEAIPRDRLLVYFIGRYKTRREYNDDPLILKYLTMIDLETR